MKSVVRLRDPVTLRASMTDDSMTGAEAAVAMLKLHGVEFIFGLCGDTSLPFYDALARLPTACAIFSRATSAPPLYGRRYARVSGKVGVCEGPSGGGVT